MGRLVRKASEDRVGVAPPALVGLWGAPSKGEEDGVGPAPPALGAAPRPMASLQPGAPIAAALLGPSGLSGPLDLL